jgi:DNA-binding transcriptional MerR regulator
MRRLRFIRRPNLGFTLDQIRDLLPLASQKDEACAEADRITAQHLVEIKQKIADPEHLANELRRLDNCCRGKGIIVDCPIVEALSPSCEAER